MSRSLTTTRRFTIKREDVDKRIVDFSDVASGRRLPPLHPGKILRDEFLITALSGQSEKHENCAVHPQDIFIGQAADAIAELRSWHCGDLVGH